MIPEDLHLYWMTNRIDRVVPIGQEMTGEALGQCSGTGLPTHLLTGLNHPLPRLLESLIRKFFANCIRE